jgi:hypothetical protein
MMFTLLYRKDHIMSRLSQPWNFDSLQAYMEYLLSLTTPNAYGEVALSIGWHSTVYGVRKMPSLGTVSYGRVATRLRKTTDTWGDIYVVTHKATDVLAYDVRTGNITLDNGGWNTMTTHRVMNAFLRATPIGVCSEAYRTVVYPRGWSHPEVKFPLTSPTVITPAMSAA